MINHLNDRVQHYATNEIFMLFGTDFMYQNAHWNYNNMDYMIEYMNENFGDKYFFKYSTPSDYIDAIAAKNLTWKVKRDDGFPYYSEGDDYWTGYFTSRPNAKSYIRKASANQYASS